MKKFAGGTIVLIAIASGAGNRARASETGGYLPALVAETNGDVNGDAGRDVSDALYLLSYLYQGGPAPVPLACSQELSVWRNCDVNGDWQVDLSDGVSLLDFLFLGGATPVSACDFDSALFGGLSPGGGGNSNPGVYSLHAKPYGKSWGEWTAAWWKWAISIPTSSHPLFDNAPCDAGQVGPVWFLGGSFAGATVTRNCLVPSGKSILFPVVNAECSTVEPPPFHGDDETTLRACAVAFMDGASTTLVATVDGSEVQDLPGYRVQSPLFSFSAPADNVLFVPGPVSGQSVSDGYWIFLAPLSTGTHTIHFEGNPGFPIDVTYVLTVGR